MTPEQIALVQESFKKVPAAEAARLFYERLFELAPALRRLFPEDLTHQGERLMAMIGTAVAGLDKPDALLPVVRDLGARHAGYGARPEYYATVGEALLWTLDQGLGEAFTDDVEQAWSAAYGLLSETMIEGAAAAPR